MRFYFSILLLLIAALAAASSECGETGSVVRVRSVPRQDPDQVKIKLEHRVENRGPKCFWSVMETLGRHNRISQLYGLTEQPGFELPPSRDAIFTFLNARGVRYVLQPYKNYDTAILRRGCKEGVGVAICISYYRDTPHGRRVFAHMMTLVSYTDDYVRFIDPNKPKLVQQADHEWFRRYWDGRAIILFPNS